MLVTKEYDRDRALAYARRYAFVRNPLYYNYAGIGGNCTNFVSQCIYAGCCTMNFTPIYGWYYLSPAERTASWTGVEFFYNFMTGNRDQGPFAEEVEEEAVLPGDVVQLGRDGEGYYHTLLVSGRAGEDILVTANSDDALDRPLSTYTYDFRRFLHIGGVRINIPDTDDCFDSLIEGIAILPNNASRPPLPPTGMPGEPEMPAEPETPSEPQPPAAPEMPNAPEMPTLPEMPNEPVMPSEETAPVWAPQARGPYGPA